MDKIEAIKQMIPTQNKVNKVRGYTKKQRAAILQEINLSDEQRKEIREYLAQYPNPEHLSFEELLQRELIKKSDDDDETGYVLTIRNQGKST